MTLGRSLSESMLVISNVKPENGSVPPKKTEKTPGKNLEPMISENAQVGAEDTQKGGAPKTFWTPQTFKKISDKAVRPVNPQSMVTQRLFLSFVASFLFAHPKEFRIHILPFKIKNLSWEGLWFPQKTLSGGRLRSPHKAQKGLLFLNKHPLRGRLRFPRGMP